MEQLSERTKETNIGLYGLTCGKDGRSLFAADMCNKTVKRIDTGSWQTVIVHTCDKESYPNDIAKMPVKGSSDPQRFAFLTQSYNPRRFKMQILEEQNGMLVTNQNIEFDAPESTVNGRLGVFQNGTIIASIRGENVLRIWIPEQQKLTALRVPQGKLASAGMCLVRQSGLYEELIALIPDDSNSVDVFRMQLNALDLLQSIQLTFKPYLLLYLQNRETLLINESDGNKNIHAVRIPEWANVQEINLSSKPEVMFCWCDVNDPKGPENAILLYDWGKKSLMKFAIE